LCEGWQHRPSHQILSRASFLPKSLPNSWNERFWRLYA